MKIFLFLLLFISANCIGQQLANKGCDSSLIKRDTTIKIFIKNVGNVYELDANFFQQEFELTSQDEKIQIISFRLSIDSYERIAIRPNKGSHVTPDLIENGINKGNDFSLRFLSPGSYVLFDEIVVKKGDTCFKASPFAIKIK